MRNETLKEIHENPISGHKGIRKTTELIQRTYNYPGLRKDIERLIKNYDTYNKIKSERHKPYGELQPLPVDSRPFETVALD